MKYSKRGRSVTSYNYQRGFTQQLLGTDLIHIREHASFTCKFAYFLQHAFKENPYREPTTSTNILTHQIR